MARPLSMTAARVKAITDAMEVGATMEVAADAGGIGQRTLYAWLEQARNARARAEAGEQLTKADEKRVQFLHAVERARAAAELDSLQTIRTAAHDGSWQAAAWYLERTRPERYAKVSRHEVVGQDGGPVAVDITPRQVLADRITEMAERMAKAPEVATP